LTAPVEGKVEFVMSYKKDMVQSTSPGTEGVHVSRVATSA